MTAGYFAPNNSRMEIAHWPLYGLRLRTPRLELRLPGLEELNALAQVAAEGVHDPQTMPFLNSWTDLPPAERARSVLQHHWRTLAEGSPGKWELQLGVFLGGVVVGSQSVSARDFTITREIHSGSWLGQRYQGQGIGTEMRAAVLYLAFEGLHARYACSAAFEDNAASLGVSRKLGYADDGIEFHVVRGRAVTTRRLRLDRDTWAAHQSVPVEISGLEPCLPSFGVTG